MSFQLLKEFFPQKQGILRSVSQPLDVNNTQWETTGFDIYLYLFTEHWHHKHKNRQDTLNYCDSYK